MENNQSTGKKQRSAYNRFDAAEINIPYPSSGKSFPCSDSQH